VRLCNWVGEVVLSIPALRRLEVAGYRLCLVGRPWARSLLEGHGWQVHARPPGLLQAAAQLRALRRELARDSDIFACTRPALLIPRSWSAALEARLAGLCPAGFDRDGRRVLLTRSWPACSAEHAAHAYWLLVSRFLGEDATFPAELGLQVAPRRQEAARALLAAHGLRPGEFTVLCPVTGSDDRQGLKVWPGFPALARELAARGIASVVCPGPGEESAAAERFAPSVQLPGLDLAAYAALMREARLVVANDTGPAHIAAAAGCAVVAVYGPQSTAAWTPIGRRVRLLHTHQGWSPLEQVLAAVLP
jgi:heptosyltransferase-2